jgi:hypothetical protein
MQAELSASDFYLTEEEITTPKNTMTPKEKHSLCRTSTAK